MKELGRVKLVQLQPTGLVIDTPSGSFYDVSRRVEVDGIQISPLGIEATTREGEHVLDIHHINHPDKAYDEDDLVCIGFTSHYKAMRARFGEHMVDGSAGENIIIEAAKEIWPEDLSKHLTIENQDTGQLTRFSLQRVAAPCSEFSHFVNNSQHERLPADKLKATLQFLGNGRRGFLLVMDIGQETATVRPGDRVFMEEME